MFALGLLAEGGEVPPRSSRPNPGSLRREVTLGERFGFISGELLWVWGEFGTGSTSDCDVTGFSGLSLKTLVADALVGSALDSRGCITF